MWASANSLLLQNIIVGQCVYVKLQCDLNLKGATCEIYSEFFFLFFRKDKQMCGRCYRASCLQFKWELCLSPNTVR